MLALYTLLIIAVALAIVTAHDDTDNSSKFCPTLYSDFTRRQLSEFNSPDGPFGISGGAKHVPVLTLSDDGKTATVVVGNGNEEGGIWHPMVASDDPETVHFITHILVKDQVRQNYILKFDLRLELE